MTTMTLTDMTTALAAAAPREAVKITSR